jgi:hypothetical protein
MKQKSDNIDLSAKQKTLLLSLGLSSEAPDNSVELEEKKSDLLYDMLNRTLPVEESIIDSLPPVLKSLSGKLHSVAGEPLGDLLQNPRTDILVIEKIKNYTKNYAKELVTSGKTRPERDIFLTIYFAAIASALVFHNKKITQHSYKDLKRFFSSFTKKNWILEEIRNLFKKAEEHCQMSEKN